MPRPINITPKTDDIAVDLEGVRYALDADGRLEVYELPHRAYGRASIPASALTTSEIAKLNQARTLMADVAEANLGAAIRGEI